MIIHEKPEKEVSISNTFKSKHLLVIMTFFCGSAVVATLASGITSAPLQEAAGMIVVPFEKSITTIGLWLTDINKSFRKNRIL